MRCILPSRHGVEDVVEAMVAFGFLLAAGILLSPVIALILALDTRRKLKTVQSSLAARERELRFLYDVLKAKGLLSSTPTPEHGAEGSTAPGPSAPPATPPSPQIEPEQTRASSDAATGPGGEPGTEPRRDTPPETTHGPAIPFEQRLATYFTRIGAGALLLGVLYFFKYAADNEWIGPAGRVLLGALAGAGVLVLAEAIRTRAHAGYVHALVGVGLSILYISSWASGARYHLISLTTAFSAGAVVLLLGAALAYRHRAEAVVLIVLVVGFLNPVLLSTNEDRALALFSYLLLLTAVALWVSTARELRTPIFVAILGVFALAFGWYDRYFQVFDHRGSSWMGDVAPERLIGAYHALEARLVPLAFSGVFTIEWLWCAFAFRGRARLAPLTKPVAVIALLFGHAALAALLRDHPLALGLAMVALAAVSVTSLHALAATRFLLIPMLAAFAILAALTHETPSEAHIRLLAVLAMWCGVYLVVFLKTALQHGSGQRSAAIQATVTLAAFGLLAMLALLGESRFLAAGVVLVPWSVALIAIAARTRTSGVALFGLIASFIAFAIAASMASEAAPTAVPWAFLGLALANGLAYLGGVMFELSRRTEARHTSLAIAMAAGLGALATGLIATPSSVPTLRAILTATTGAIDIALAAAIARRRPDRQDWIRISSALGLALLAPAIAFGLSGATVTVVWAMLAAVALAIFGESRDRAWLAVAVALLFAALARVVFVDLGSVEDQALAFQLSRGREGALSVTPFFNARAYALLGSGLALLLGGYFLARAARARADARLRVLTPIVVALAWTLITSFFVVEVRATMLNLPEPPPVHLDDQEFAVFMDSVRAAEAASMNARAMVTTMTLAGVALFLVVIGFAAREMFHRYLGLALFLATLAKLVLWDVWTLARVYQIGVLSAVGAMLLGSGFLYARLRALFRAPPRGPFLVIVGLALTSASAEATPRPKAEVSRLAHRAAIEGVSARGEHVLRVDRDLFIHSRSEQLFADLRITDAEGMEVPYVVRTPESLDLTPLHEGRILDPGRLPGEAFRATFELPERAEHCHVELELSGPSPYLRRTRVETGNAPSELARLAEGALVWSIDAEGVNSRSSAIDYPRSMSRYVRITLFEDPNAAPTELTAATFSCPSEAAAPALARVPLTMVSTREDPERGATEIELDAGEEGVPIERLALRIATPELVRRAEVRASAFRTAWPSVGHGVLYRVGREGPESTSLPVSVTRKRYFKLIVENRRDEPLAIQQVEGAYRELELIFRAQGKGAHWLYVGDAKDLTAPATYDLEEILTRRTEPLALQRARLGAFEPNPTFGVVPPQVLPFTEQHRGVIGALLLVIVSGLALWALRLLKGAASSPD